MMVNYMNNSIKQRSDNKPKYKKMNLDCNSLASIFAFAVIGAGLNLLFVMIALNVTIMISVQAFVNKTE